MRIARLDGIRAIAILLVFFYHHRLLNGSGRAGVDLFFVLSGLLITRVLRASYSEPAYWSRFYFKRAIRILPPLALLFALCFALSPHIGFRTFAGYALFLGNWMNITPYADAFFLVLWSLSVEEHFYIFWPFAVKFLQWRRLIVLTACILIAGPILRGVFTSLGHSSQEIYYLTPFRLDSLAAGSLLAILTESVRVENWLRRWSAAGLLFSFSTVALVRLVIPNFSRDQNSVAFNALGYSLVTAMCFFFVSWVLLAERGWINSLLSLKPLVYLGRISYGVYLFQPMILLTLLRIFHIPADAANPSQLHKLFLLDAVATLALATLSFRLYETPILNWGHRLAKKFQSTRVDPAESEPREIAASGQ